MGELCWEKILGCKEDTYILTQDTEPILNEYGCFENVRYELYPDNSMIISIIINGQYVGDIARVP